MTRLFSIIIAGYKDTSKKTLAAALAQEVRPDVDFEVLMLDNLSTQRYGSLYDLPKEGNFRFLEADVLETDLRPMVAEGDTVVHLAAITDATTSQSERE